MRGLDNWIMGINDPNAPFNQNDEEEDEDGFVKFECQECGCYFWVKDRSGFECPNCQDRWEEADAESRTIDE